MVKCIAQGHTATDKHRARFRASPAHSLPSAGPISTAEMADSMMPKDTQHANISLGLSFVI